MFRDEVEIEVLAGKGGNGIVSFRHEKYVPRGGPDGGDGGRGGSVILVASSERNSLLSIGRRRRYAARKGAPGGPNDKFGAAGEDLRLDVPVGTQVYDAERGNLLADLDEVGGEVIAAQGGACGRGNARFKNSVNQAPRKATKGTEGEHRKLRLELKLLAEVGLVGLPNAGKSTFLATVTAARPKVADYPFTTLRPMVGIAEVGDHDTLCIADLPGLIEGASSGRGLGHRFLRHVERCGVLIHLVDCSCDRVGDPLEAVRTVEEELEKSSMDLAGKSLLLVASKCEDAEAEEAAQALEGASGRTVWRLSSATGSGVRELLEAARALVRGA